MITPKMIKEKSMTAEKKKISHNNYFPRFVLRPVSYVLTVPFLEAGVSANMVSFLSIFVSIAAFILLGFTPGKAAQIAGVLMFFLWCVMDCVDGNIARYTGKASAHGVLWDAAAGYVSLPLMYFSMGVSVMNMGKGVFPLVVPDYYYVVLGALTAMFTLYPRLVLHKKEAMFTESVGKEFTDKTTYSMAENIMLNLTSSTGFLTPIMLVAVIFDLGREFTLAYFLIHLAITLVSMMRIMKED